MPRFGKFCGHAHGILHGVRIRRSVRDDADALDAQQRRSAVLGVVEALFEIGERAARQQRSDLPRDGCFERFLKSGADQVGDAFGNLQGDIADESVGDDHIDFSIVEIAAFDVADKIQRKLLQELKGLAGQIVALGLFFADREQADARMLDSSPNMDRK